MKNYIPSHVFRLGDVYLERKIDKRVVNLVCNFVPDKVDSRMVWAGVDFRVSVVVFRGHFRVDRVPDFQPDDAYHSGRSPEAVVIAHPYSCTLWYTQFTEVAKKLYNSDRWCIFWKEIIIASLFFISWIVKKYRTT